MNRKEGTKNAQAVAEPNSSEFGRHGNPLFLQNTSTLKPLLAHHHSDLRRRLSVFFGVQDRGTSNSIIPPIWKRIESHSASSDDCCMFPTVHHEIRDLEILDLGWSRFLHWGPGQNETAAAVAKFFLHFHNFATLIHVLLLTSFPVVVSVSSRLQNSPISSSHLFGSSTACKFSILCRLQSSLSLLAKRLSSFFLG